MKKVIIEEVKDSNGNWFYVHRDGEMMNTLRVFYFIPNVIEGQILSRSKSYQEAKEYALTLKTIKETRQIIETL